MALAALSKPQALAILPLLAVAARRRHGSRRLAAGAVAGAVVSAVVFPALPGDRSSRRIDQPTRHDCGAAACSHWKTRTTSGGCSASVLECWIASDFWGPLTDSAFAAILVIGHSLFVCALYVTRRVSFAEAAALSVLGWFMFTTRAHENYLFMAIPLLALAWPQRPILLLPFAVISLSVFLNMILHDQLALDPIGLWPAGRALQMLRLVCTWINVLLLVGWVAAAVRRTPAGSVRWAVVAAFAQERHMTAAPAQRSLNRL